MDQTVLLWILAGILTAMGAIAALLWRHVEHCKEVHTKLAELSGDVKRVVQDIGTHETGLRGTVHKTANAIQRIEMELAHRREDFR